ncbi:hypothetical protein RMSM_01655 [Rhodopirellula maiorica SM1]|uniref:Uncharacterized protein n=1 Tax=Rhodopirellula maiorica SM1 TaxID=1265738 RepID=M5RQ03_9BACT|nr:hypothetical protein RMSM_01655 [Rhodopirellula maiorica SM1]
MDYRKKQTMLAVSVTTRYNRPDLRFVLVCIGCRHTVCGSSHAIMKSIPKWGQPE